MMRTVVVAGALLLGVGAVMAQQDVAVQQDNLMRAQSMYGVLQDGEGRNSLRSGSGQCHRRSRKIRTDSNVFTTQSKMWERKFME